MLFKQAQIFHLTESLSYSESFLDRLAGLEFSQCLPSMPSSMGWVSPVADDDEEAILARTLNGCIMVCLQFEEKILPASVVNLALKERVKHLETIDARKIRKKEKLSLKDDVVQTLMPRAFTKLSQIYAYIDSRNKWLVLNTISPKKTEDFLTMFKKTFGDIVESLEVTKPSSIITPWLKDQSNPTEFSIEKTCVLQDPEQQNRVIRCQQQDLFAGSIQSLISDGCLAVQIGLCWFDRVNFVLADDFTLRGIHLAEDDLVDLKDEAETKRQKFDADFFIMTEMYTALLTDLLKVFSVGEKKLAKTG